MKTCDEIFCYTLLTKRSTMEGEVFFIVASECTRDVRQRGHEKRAMAQQNLE